MNAGPRVALTTYSVKPRGGVVHTLELAEALTAKSLDVTVVALGDPDEGFFRPVAAPVQLLPAPPWGDTLEARVFASIDTMTEGLAGLTDRFDVVHSQDCISARAAVRVRDAGAPIHVVRTVHHIDDFTTPALVDCQRQAILEPDVVLVVSEFWQRRLREELGVDATVVTNGVRADRFAPPADPIVRTARRATIGAADRFVFLTVGGIEPRKGSEHLIRALALLKASHPDPPMLVVVGGHSFQDYRAYRERVLASVPELGLELDRDVVLLGTVPDESLPGWFHAADGFVFPSVSEGWGLVILEAMSAGLPVVASDIDVFREFLTHERDAILTRAGDTTSLAAGMARLLDEAATSHRLRMRGPAVAARYPWSRTADQHLAIYDAVRQHA
jgi:glycosyltransferase-like protein